ncbi:UdgX family uracil-DNA binding protein [Arenimonas sp. MALMAid1274]|uniref:UdgX family uracil-DNA binding protein n=1 Tax=Arenimonas sp. MALMAid1274 TaxID=3411630 RepID=UPI003BA1D62F
MYSAKVDPPWDGAAWRPLARAALRAGVAPPDIDWSGDAQATLMPGPSLDSLPPLRATPRVPSDFLSLADAVLCHRDPQRHALLYRLLWRIAEGERGLLERATDPDVRRAQVLEKAVGRDSHKMKAFVRFRAVPGHDNTFVAWFEPAHYILDRVAPFFARRFAGMHWAISTPYRSVRWDGAALAFGPGGAPGDVPAEDAQEDAWRIYYANIFNPARLNPTMMRQEMPQKYWKNLPEAAELPRLIQGAGARVRDMAEREAQPARRRIPERVATPLPAPSEGLAAARRAASDCRACPLWQPATQTVFGEGPDDARVMVVGEQPGDEEDLRGRPFVGPSGKLLDQALAELGLDRSTFYLTNAVKHFRFDQRGKARLHRNPDALHVQACQRWLMLELASLRPDIVLCLGATAARAVLGPGFRLMQERGRWHALPDGTRVLATVHPSWILRQRDPAARESAWRGFLHDLRLLLPPSAP